MQKTKQNCNHKKDRVCMSCACKTCLTYPCDCEFGRAQKKVLFIERATSQIDTPEIRKEAGELWDKENKKSI